MSVGGRSDRRQQAGAFVISAVAAPLPLVLYVLFGFDVSGFDNGHDQTSVAFWPFCAGEWDF